MARIRTVKPEFFTSESVCECSPLARLFFIGLWCEADREGLLHWKPKTLKIRYLPVDKCDIEKLASELIEQKMIKIYSDDEGDICSITGFSSHQVINNREKDSELLSRVNDASPRVKAEGRKGKEGKEGERKGKEQAWQAPQGLNIDAWNEFEAHRKAIRKPLSDLARSKAANQIKDLPQQEQQRIVDKSIQAGWSGLFPENGNKTNQSSHDLSNIDYGESGRF